MKSNIDNLGLVNLIQSLISLEIGNSLDITQKLNEKDMAPKYILTACEAAMIEINELYDSGEYFIASLIMAGEIMNRVIKLISPRMLSRARNYFKGRVAIGTVRGEIHGLGKNIAGALLAAYGFEVRDLGVDVSERDFVECAKDWKPDVIGLSVLLTSCFHSLEETIVALRDLRGAEIVPYIFISGAQVTPALKDFYQADFYAGTVFDTVRLCEKLCSERPAMRALARAV
ncbi:MAG: cobalamin-dependent protein [Deltaproteobacteria bacterium]|jgi:5-methyltetrahydrofolate--homocysteine methyltransferase|nr:cobalamin-dependent protein [Deltaproteobacteria bacterium]